VPKGRVDVFHDDAQPSSLFKKKTSTIIFSVSLFWKTQLLPPSVVQIIVPESPTAHPYRLSTK